jgi:hypothetical protein
VEAWVTFEQFLKLLSEAEDWSWSIVAWGPNGIVLKIRNDGETKKYHSPSPFDYSELEFGIFRTQVMDIIEDRRGDN